MNSRSYRWAGVAMAGMLIFSVLALAAEQQTVPLPEPKSEGGKALMEALKTRQSTHEFSAKAVPKDVLSSLLWAAWGVNRPESGKRTAPSAKNTQEVEIYMAMADGAYRYDAAGHRLERVSAEDLRGKTGGQSFVATAPVNLAYVANFSKSAGSTDEDKVRYATISTGCIVQNVYLFCASEGLGTVVRSSTGGPELARALGLSADQRVIMTQTVGYRAP